MSAEDEEEVVLRELFNSVDKDLTGFIDETELAAVVDLHPKDLKEIFSQLDSDSDGKISLKEFVSNYKKFQSLADELERRQTDEPETEDIKFAAEGVNSRHTLAQPPDGKRSVGRSPDKRRDGRRRGAKIRGQEYLDDLYEIARSKNDPALLQSLESFLAATVENLHQKDSENEKLDLALRRATEKNTEIARSLEEEMEQQVAMLEAKIREEEKRKLEQERSSIAWELQRAYDQLHEMEGKVIQLEERVAESAQELGGARSDNIDLEKIEHKAELNKVLERQLLEFQTQMALMRSEVAKMKTEYDEQADRLAKERETVLLCVQEQENLMRQLHLLHEANKKLHDTNDDLRSALEDRKKADPNRSPQIKHSSSLQIRTPKSHDQHESFGRDRPSRLSDLEPEQVPSKRVDDDVNENSLLSEIMAADGKNNSTAFGRLSKGPFSLQRATDTVDLNMTDEDNTANCIADLTFEENSGPARESDNSASRPLNELASPNQSSLLDATMPASDREQFIQQLQILCDTNRRLGESNDELRQALSLLSDRLRKESVRRKKRSSPSGSQSAPVTPIRKPSERVQPQRTSSPHKRLSKTNLNSLGLSDTASTVDMSEDLDTELDSSSLYAVRPDASTHDAALPSRPGTQLCSCGSKLENSDLRLCEQCLQKVNETIPEAVALPSLNESLSLEVEDDSDTTSEDVAEILTDDDTTHATEAPVLSGSENDVTRASTVGNEIGLRLPVEALHKSVQFHNIKDLPESDVTDLDRTCSHVCDKGSCPCDDVATDDPLEKSQQVSEFLLTQQEEDVIYPVLKRDPDSSLENLTLDDTLLQWSAAASVPCPVCHSGLEALPSGAAACKCAEGLPGDVAQNKNKRRHASPDKSKLPSFSDPDSSSHYTGQETFPSATLDLVRQKPIGSEDDQDATYETGTGLTSTRFDTTSTTGHNSSYSVYHNIQNELSMYARRQPDEAPDEDDMDEDELVRLVDQTNDDTSDSIAEDNTVQFVESPLLKASPPQLEERVPAAGADASVESARSQAGSDHGTPERMFKLVLAGDAAVGKSSFIIRLCKDKFYSALNATLGVDFQMKTLSVDSHTIALQLWDTAGQERFRSIAKSYFRKVDGVILLYDVTCENSFMDVRDWVQSVEESATKRVPIIICGNKTDLRPACIARGQPVISRKQGEKLARAFGAQFVETSAKDGTGVMEACQQLARELMQSNFPEVANGGLKLDEPGEGDKAKTKGCCKS